MLRTSVKRFLSLILVLAMSCSFFSVCFAADDAIYGDVYEYPVRTPVKFSEMDTDYSDITKIESALDDMMQIMNTPGMLNQLKADWNLIVEETDMISAAASVSFIQSMLDSTDEEKYAHQSSINLALQIVGDKILNVLNLLMSSPYAEEMKTYVGDDIIADALEHNAFTDEELALRAEQLDILQEYYTLIQSGDRQSELKAAEIYLKLLDNLIAQSSYMNNYNNYAEFAYKTMFYRDFRPDDIALLQQWAKDFAMPRVLKLNTLLYSKLNMFDYYSVHRTTDEIIESVRPYLTSISPKAKEAFEAMLEYELYDIDPSDVKNLGSFTSSIDYYGLPFIYINPVGNAADTESLIHEFGHFLSWYVNPSPAPYRYDSYDTCEIDSQALEILMAYFADEIFSEDLFGTVLVNNIYTLLTAVVEGCLFDEFQQTAFAMRMDGTLNTPQDVCNLYLDIENEYYGPDTTSWGHNWYYVHHTFEQPFYYISYATSATAALGFLGLAAEDYIDAVEAYNGLIELGNNYGFSRTLDYLNMPNPLTEEGLIELSDSIGAFIDEIIQVYGADDTIVSDVELPVTEDGSKPEGSPVFSSEDAGLSVYMDEKEWVVYNDEQIRQVFGVSAEMFESAELDDFFESGQQLVQFMAARNDGLSNINIVAQKLPLNMSLMDEETIVDASLEATLSAISAAMNILEYETGFYEAAGEDHGAIFMHSELQGQDVYQLLIFIKSGNMLYQVTATSFNEDLTDYVLSTVSAWDGIEAVSDPAAGSKVEPDNDFTFADYSGFDYINSDAGFGISMDKDWIVYDDEQIREVFGFSAELFDSAALEESLQSGQQLALFMAVKNDGLSNINIIAQKLPVTARFLSEEFIAEQSLDATIRELSSAMTVLDYETGLYEFAGKDHGALYLHSQFEDQEIFQIIVNVKVDDMMYQITATSFNEDLTDYILGFGSAL